MSGIKGDITTNQNAKDREDFLESLKHYPQAFHEWVASLGWKHEELTEVEMRRPTYPDGVDGQGWKRRKQSSHFFVTVGRGEDPKEEDETKAFAIFQATFEVFQLV